MKQVKIISGVSGSGKTHYIKEALLPVMRQHHQAVEIVSANDYFLINDEYKFDKTKLPEAHGMCFRRFIDACQRDADIVIVDNTCCTTEEIAPYMLGGNAYGYKVEIITLALGAYRDVELACGRSLHQVPLYVVQRQHNLLQNRKMPKFWSHRTRLAEF